MTKKNLLLFAGVAAIIIFATAAVILAVTVSESFADETKIGKGTVGVNIDTSGGQVSLAPCYSPNPGWSKIADTTVRDISGAYNATVDKDIYCDASNCVLWTNGVEISNTVCIATDSNVYGNILWSASDVSGTKTWGPTTTAISGGDIGGTHPTIGVGNNNVAVGTKNWLERYYISDLGTYLAMDNCKAKGNGWRLPTILELDSIRDQAKGSAPYSYLPAIIAGSYWSSTEYSTSNAYYLNFLNGTVGSYYKSSAYYVRCVRGY